MRPRRDDDAARVDADLRRDARAGAYWLRVMASCDVLHPLTGESGVDALDRVLAAADHAGYGEIVRDHIETMRSRRGETREVLNLTDRTERCGVRGARSQVPVHTPPARHPEET
jgi:hypothetical protein